MQKPSLRFATRVKPPSGNCRYVYPREFSAMFHIGVKTLCSVVGPYCCRCTNCTYILWDGVFLSKQYLTIRGNWQTSMSLLHFDEESLQGHQSHAICWRLFALLAKTSRFALLIPMHRRRRRTGCTGPDHTNFWESNMDPPNIVCRSK